MSNLRIVAAQVVKTSQAWLCPMPERSSLGKYSIGAYLRQAPTHADRGRQCAGELVCEAEPGDGEDDDGHGFVRGES